MQKIVSIWVLFVALICSVASLQAAVTPLVNHADEWFYHKGTNAPQADWKSADDDQLDTTQWVPGQGGFGYADNTPEVSNCGTILDDMLNRYTTVYTRRQFTVSGEHTNLHLFLRVDYDDGFIAWLDGVYLTHRATPGAPLEPAYTTSAIGDHESSLGTSSPKPAEIFDLGEAPQWLTPGTHTLAVIGLNGGSGSSDFVLVTDLYLDTPPPPPTSTDIVRHGDLWYYHKGTNAPQSNWKTVDDSGLNTVAWATGRGGFGYATAGGQETNNCLTILDAYNRYSTIYMRRQFTITNTLPANKNVYLRMDWDDGFMAWLDGQYLLNRNVSGAPNEPSHTASASPDHESSLGGSGASPAETFDLGSVTNLLTPGVHTLAIIGLNGGSGSSDLIQVADLFIDTAPPPPVRLTNRWLAADSPIVVSNTVNVSNLVTLIIEEGTTLHLNSGASIVVADGGRLIAEGTSNAPIRFIRPTTSSPTWGNIVINGSVGSPESRIIHAYIAGNGSSPAIDVSGGTLWLEHTSFGTTSRQYLYVDGASFVISDCYFPASTAGEPLHGTGGIKEGGRGIFLRNFFGAISGYNDTIDFSGGQRPGPIVQFINNVFMGSGDDNLDLDGTDAWVEGNIFMHVHKNGSPDTASAVSGGYDSGNGDVTIVRNVFYDCDQAAMGKEENFYVLINNTVVRQTHIGGLDNAGAIICLQDHDMPEGRGMFLEGNIFYDIEALTRDAVNSINTFTNNLMPLAWAGPGGGNSTADPMLTYIPQLSETYFTNWADAQIMKQWFVPAAGSPAIGTGPNGVDRGAIIPSGARISGEPASPTTETSATLYVGVNRTGNGIPVSNWPNGAGYTHYRWRLDTNAWSAEVSINTPITLTSLSEGPHYVEVIGKNDANYFQNDPDLGSNATITRSKTWLVQSANQLRIDTLGIRTNAFVFTFEAQAGKTYQVQSSDSLNPPNWLPFREVSRPTNAVVEIVQPDVTSPAVRFYRLVTP